MATRTRPSESARPADLPGFFGPVIPVKMALRQRGAHGEESIQRRWRGRLPGFFCMRERVPSAGLEQRPESQFEFRRLSVSICRLLHDSLQGLAPLTRGLLNRGRAEWDRDAAEKVLRGGLQAIERARLAALDFSTGVDVLEPEVRLAFARRRGTEL